MRELIQCVQNSNSNNDVKQTISAIKNAGFDGVFVQLYHSDYGVWETNEIEQIELCKKLNLKIEFAHLSYKKINEIWNDGEAGEELTEMYLRDLQTCHNHKINLVVMHLCSKHVAPKPNGMGLLRLKRIVKKAEELGMRIAFENTKIQGYLEFVLDNIQSNNIGVCFDSGHYHCHFDDNFNWEKFKDRIFAVHLHDNDKSDDQHLLPFDGTLDWKDCIKKLQNANYTGPITLESRFSEPYDQNMTVEQFYEQSRMRAEKLAILTQEVSMQSTGLIYLTSGGYVDGQRGEKLDGIIEYHAFGSNVLVVDNATTTGSNVKGLKSLLENLKKIAKNVDKLTLSNDNCMNISSYDMIYITGGDVAPLIDVAKSKNVKMAIYEYVKNGGVIFGESAGSMIFGKDLKWCYDIKKGTKPKYNVQLDSYKGFGFFDINFYPHWDKASTELKEKALTYAKDSGVKLSVVCDGEFIQMKPQDIKLNVENK